MKRGTDFNDLHQVEGPDAVRACIEMATSPPESPALNAGPLPYVELLRGEAIKPEAVSWLWNGYLVGGKVNIFAGAPGTGKTTLARALAATIPSDDSILVIEDTPEIRLEHPHVDDVRVHIGYFLRVKRCLGNFKRIANHFVGVWFVFRRRGKYPP